MGQTDVPAIVAKQIQHQVRLTRQRMAWWLPWIFVTGLAVSILGLILQARLPWKGWPALGFSTLALLTAYFGWVVFLWLFGPYGLWPSTWLFPFKPRIVPYFARELARYGGKTMTAFARGRGVYREIAALEQLAGSLGVAPLSAYGFAYDHYGQEVRWHDPAEGLRTIEALQQNLGAELAAGPDVTQDLKALASILREAADQKVCFSLVLRLHPKDNMQAVCTREVRQGSFW
ncbi:MAG TPA: hypothetical protein VLE48_07760 [Terriglobales bacterium]|nr:hypothetical protein [Terriglobales bacterium]